MFGLVEVNNLALGEQHEPIEHLEDVRVWLMDGAYNCPATSCQIPKDFHDTGGCETIETGSWFI